MAQLRNLLLLVLLTAGPLACNRNPAANDLASLRKTTQSIRDAFARGDVPAIVALHHPDVIKYFGGNNVVVGRAAIEKSLRELFQTSKMEFIENKVESTVFCGETAIETSIFGINVIPKSGGKPSFFRGRSMVIYIRYKESPTGWASIREMTQAAPDQNN